MLFADGILSDTNLLGYQEVIKSVHTEYENFCMFHLTDWQRPAF